MSFIVFLSSVSNLDKDKDVSFGVDTSIFSTTEKTHDAKLSKILLMSLLSFEKHSETDPGSSSLLIFMGKDGFPLLPKILLVSETTLCSS